MKKINYKLINTLLVIIIIFLIWLMKDLWLGVLTKIIDILLPFILAFAIGYVLHPLLKKMVKRGIPKTLALVIIGGTVVLFISFILWLLIPNILPLIFEQTTSLFSSLIKFVQDLSTKHDVNLVGVKDAISEVSTQITSSLGKGISDGFISIINQSLGIITKLIIIIIVAIYFLSDMERIRDEFEKFLASRKNKKTLRYFRKLDEAIHNYVNAFALYALIIFIQYTTVFYLIGHPHYLLLGLLSAIGTIIPYFGGIVTNLIAIITASVISPKLLVLSIIVSLIFPQIDGYFTSPKIYNKSNQIPTILSIFAVFAGGALAGAKGIILALPITIILLTTYRFYRSEITSSIGKITKISKE
ncbi:MAG TPA: AI-2E family transporter [Mollicutes bacterium]|nr:AI-2E family transporter [Mollicutes bacterium]